MFCFWQIIVQLVTGRLGIGGAEKEFILLLVYEYIFYLFKRMKI